ncbi:integrator complex subunit 3-like [Tropilaelaps mercedesae]|uniref:SOSS complex subunit A homolog n=1 Tax=Tropilaelaps mercedesae TaxID=418985 RepID=A0A1V9XAM2_9ACAR|nr:integrator complex subunit 3-like [Tropilaelaps mercedesae]
MSTSASTSPAASRLFVSSALERDESGVEEKLDQGLALLQALTQNVSDNEAIEGLTQHVCRSQPSHEEVSLGLLAVMLTEPSLASRFYRDLTLVSRDGMQTFITQLIQVAIERYAKLSEVARNQLLWLTRELIKHLVPGTDAVVLNLLRQVQGGDVSPRNVWLAEALLNLLCENSIWLEKFPILLATSVYTYLRLIVDHFSPQFVQLRQREIDFCAKTLREKFQECSMIGRDLVRVLQNVARIPEFEALWRDFLERPSTLSPSLTGGVAQLLATRTPRRFLQSRVTPDMERKLYFMTHQVKLGQQRRYQDWFHKQYLSTPESQSLRCDLIRYICCFIHPSNEILCSDILPRWAVIGWLLMTCLSNVEASNCKMALFYDWLVFDAEKDNIMNIEPAILVMFHSIRPHPQITATLWDFLIRIMREFSKPLADRIRQGIHTSLRVILEKRVLSSLAPLFDYPRLDNELKNCIRENFSEFYTADMKKQPIVVDDGQGVGAGLAVQPAPIHPVVVDGSPVIINCERTSEMANVVFRPIKVPEVRSAGGTTATPQDAIAKLKQEVKLASQIGAAKLVDEKKPAMGTTTAGGLATTAAGAGLAPGATPVIIQIGNSVDNSPSPPAIDEYLEGLPEPFKTHMNQLQKERDTERQCAVIERLMQDLIECDNFDRPLAKQLGACFSHVLNDEFTRNVLPDTLTNETLENAIGTPLFVLLRSFCQTSAQHESRRAQLQILVEMSLYQPRLSVLLLFYQRVKRVHLTNHDPTADQPSRGFDSTGSPYEELVVAKNAKHSLEDALRDDLALCEQAGHVRLLCFLVPEVYTQFASAALGHSDLLHLVLSVIDSTQLQQLCCQCLQGELTMLTQDNFLPLAKASLRWETFEQMAFWSLLQAHRFQAEWLLPLLPLLNFEGHQEACNNAMLILAAQKPTQELVQVLLARDIQDKDILVLSLLKHWAILCADVLAEVLATMVVPQKGNKRRRQTKSQAAQSIQQALLHLDQLRQNCGENTDFFATEPLHSALQHAQVAANENQRAKFAQLFALAADDDSEEEYTPVREKSKARSSNRGKRGGAGSVSGSPQKRSTGASGGGGAGKKDRGDDEGSDTEYDSSTEEETSKPKPPRKRRKQLVSDSD